MSKSSLSMALLGRRWGPGPGVRPPSLTWWEILLGAADGEGLRWRRLRENPPLSRQGTLRIPPQLQVSLGGGQAGEAWEASKPETKRLSGFISPVSRVVDGTTVIRACLSSTLCRRVRPARAPEQRTAGPGPLAHLSQRPSPLQDLSFLAASFLSLVPSLSILLTLRRGRTMLNLILLPPSIFEQPVLLVGLFGFREMWTRLPRQGWQ